MTLRVNLISCSRIKHIHVWGTCQCKEHRFFNMHSRVKECHHDTVTKILCIHLQGDRASFRFEN